MAVTGALITTGLTRAWRARMSQHTADVRVGSKMSSIGTSMQGLNGRRNFTHSFIKPISLQDRKEITHSSYIIVTQSDMGPDDIC